MRRLLLTGVLALCWGTSFLWLKFALTAFSPAAVTTMRLLLGALTCGGLSLLLRQRLPRSPRQLVQLLVAAVLAMTIPFTALAFGEQHASSSVAGVVNGTSPAWAFLLAATLNVENLGMRALGAVTLCLAGTSVFALGATGSGRTTLAGVAACLIAAMAYGFSYVYLDSVRLTDNFGPSAVSTIQLVLAAAVSLPLLLSSDARPVHDVTFRAVASLLLLVLLGTSISYLLYHRLIHDYGGLAASTVGCLIPVVALVAGALFDHDRITVPQMVGAGVVVIGLTVMPGRLPAAGTGALADEPG